MVTKKEAQAAETARGVEIFRNAEPSPDYVSRELKNIMGSNKIDISPAAFDRLFDYQLDSYMVPTSGSKEARWIRIIEEDENKQILIYRDEKNWLWERIADHFNMKAGLIPYNKHLYNDEIDGRLHNAPRYKSYLDIVGKRENPNETDVPTAPTARGAPASASTDVPPADHRPQLFDTNTWAEKAPAVRSEQSRAEREAALATGSGDASMDVTKAPANESDKSGGDVVMTEDAGPSTGARNSLSIAADNGTAAESSQAASSHPASSSRATGPVSATTTFAADLTGQTGASIDPMETNIAEKDPYSIPNPSDKRMMGVKEIYSRWQLTHHAIDALNEQIAKEKAAAEKNAKKMKSFHAKKPSAEWDPEADMKLVEEIEREGRRFWGRISTGMAAHGKNRTLDQCLKRYREFQGAM